MRTKDIVLIGMLGAVLVAVQYTLAFLPNIELVSLLIIVYSLVLNRKAPYIICLFILLEGLLFGFGLWWINYLYIWGILYLVVTILKKERSSFIWAMISGGFGFSFGALCSIPYFFMGVINGSLRNGLQSAFAYWIAGIPFDLIHGIANYIIALVLFKPIYQILTKLYPQDLSISKQTPL
jgi:energy-coupling factor transport system substrate-specific component